MLEEEKPVQWQPQVVGVQAQEEPAVSPLLDLAGAAITENVKA